MVAIPGSQRLAIASVSSQDFVESGRQGQGGAISRQGRGEGRAATLRKKRRIEIAKRPMVSLEGLTPPTR